MPYIGRAPTASITKLEDADQDTKIQVEESSDEDIIRFDIAGAEDFTMTANTFTAAASSIVALDDGAVGTPALTNTGDLNTGVYFPAADTVGVVSGGTEQFRFGSNPIPGGSKNLIQNGAMTVNQHGSVAVSADQTFTLDRFQARLINGAGRFTVTQDTTVPAGEGFGYSLKVDITTDDSSISASEYYVITHTIEAQNLQHLNFNNAASESLTLTFWARAKKAGLHGGAVYNNDANRSLVFSWTAVADTWQKVTVPVPAETSAGTINNDTGAGLSIYWGLGAGNYLASDTDAWVAGAKLQVTSAVNDLDSTSNDFYLTGVQLEIGDVATDFAHEDIGTTFNKCQRYFKRIQKGADVAFGDGWVQGVNDGRIRQRGNTSVPGPVMRAEPTKTFSAVTDFEVAGWNGGTSRTFYTCDTLLSLSSAVSATSSTYGMGTYLWVADVSSGPAGDDPVWIQYANNDAYIQLDAEL